MAGSKYKKPALICFLIFGLIDSSLCAVTTLDFFPFEIDDGASTMTFSDDNYEHVALSSPFKFLNRTQSDIWISSNGVILFKNDTATSSPRCSVSSDDVTPKIMPFWADAVWKPGSRIRYMQSQSRTLLDKARREISQLFRLNQKINLSWMLIVTWADLAGYDMVGPGRNTFQSILVSDSTGENSFVITYYNKIEWAHVGSKAPSVGFDPGFGRPMFTLPGACSNLIKGIPSDSNIGAPGKFIFKVDSEVATAMSCEDLLGDKEKLIFNPRVVPLTGHVPILIEDFCVDSGFNASITCIFRDPGRTRPTQTEAVIVSRQEIVCPVPFLYTLGRMRVDIQVKYRNKGQQLFENSILVVDPHDFRTQPIMSVNKSLGSSSLITVHWDPDAVAMERIRELDRGNDSCHLNGGSLGQVEIVLLEYDGKNWAELGPITKPAINSGVLIAPFNTTRLREFVTRGKGLLRIFAIKGKYTSSSKNVVETMLPCGMAQSMDIVANQLSGSPAATEDHENTCKTWYAKEPYPQLDTAPCPPSIKQAKMDWRFALDKNAYFKFQGNPNISAAYIQRVPSPSGSGAQCVYDIYGNLVSKPPFAGSLHRKSPMNCQDPLSHYREDVFPYLHCCKWGPQQDVHETCSPLFYKKRPSISGSKYKFPQFARMLGQGHITTFDGLSYTFLAEGEYLMIKYASSPTAHYPSNRFRMHVAIGSTTPVITAIAMFQQFLGEELKVQVQYNEETAELNLKIDEDIVEFDPNVAELNLYYAGLVITFKSKTEALFTFATGFSFKVMSGHGVLPSYTKALNIIATADPGLSGSEGLWGNMDGEMLNDFRIPNGSTLLGTDPTLMEIYNKFGALWRVQSSDLILTSESAHAYFSPPALYQHIKRPAEVTSNATRTGFCGDDENCLFDFHVTFVIDYAMATKMANVQIKEIEEAAAFVLQQCPSVSLSALGDVRMNFDNYNVGSILQVGCKDGFDIFPGLESINFTCEVGDGVKDSRGEEGQPRWMSSQFGEIKSSYTCNPSTRPQGVVKDYIVDKHDTEMSQSGGQETLSHLKSGGSQFALGEMLALMLGAAIVLVVAVALFMKYPSCAPVRQRILFAYRGLRG